MSIARFQVAYDGEAVRTGSMDVYDLAPALLAIGDLVKEANRTFNGDEVAASVRVESDFRRGSFEVSLILDQGLLEQARQLLFGNTPVEAEAVIKALFGIGTGTAAVIVGVVKIYKALKGEKPQGGITIINNGPSINGTAIVRGNGISLDSANIGSAILYDNDAIREATKKMFQPLERNGIECLEVKQGAEVLERVTKAEVASFHPPDVTIEPNEHEATKVSHRETVLRVIRPSFKHGNNYYVSEGGAEFYVAIEDRGFLAEVDSDAISFSAHGRMEVVLRQETTPGEKKDDIKFAVERVLRYVKAPIQLSLVEQPQTDPPMSTPAL